MTASDHTLVSYRKPLDTEGVSINEIMLVGAEAGFNFHSW